MPSSDSESLSVSMRSSASTSSIMKYEGYSHSQPRLRQRVRFGDVEIRDMPVMLGEHPPTEGGAPITIGWEAVGVRHLSVDVFEICRADDPVRKEAELKWDISERADVLFQAGYSIEEIVQASEDARELTKRREESLAAQGRESWQLFRESARKKFNKVLHPRAA